LSRLVERVEAGEEIVIARAGRPVARLVPMTVRTQPRTPGRWRGQVVLRPDFDAGNEEIADLFEGR